MAAKRRSKTDKTTAAEKSAEDKSAVGNRLTRLLFRPRMLICLATAVALTAAVPVGLKRLPKLHERPEYRLQTANISINEPPRYVPSDLLQQVIELAELPDELSLLDDGLVARVASSFARHPWVAEVVEVKKAAPARLTVTLRYRCPIAMVKVQQGVYPVDVEGRLLPPADFSVAETARYPLILNVKSTPLGPAGQMWGDATVVAAARLADILQADWEQLKLAAIYAPRQTVASQSIADVQLELVTEGGSHILWGRAPGSNYPGELQPEKKIGRLKKYQADFGSFDEPLGPYEIDIRHWQEISRRPLVQRGWEVQQTRSSQRN
jgi:cell division septal protein FtsQ